MIYHLDCDDRICYAALRSADFRFWGIKGQYLLGMAIFVKRIMFG
jgi:hypothetical protein